MDVGDNIFEDFIYLLTTCLLLFSRKRKTSSAKPQICFFLNMNVNMSFIKSLISNPISKHAIIVINFSLELSYSRTLPPPFFCNFRWLWIIKSCHEHGAQTVEIRFNKFLDFPWFFFPFCTLLALKDFCSRKCCLQGSLLITETNLWSFYSFWPPIKVLGSTTHRSPKMAI